MRTLGLIALVFAVIVHFATPSFGSGDAQDPDLCDAEAGLCVTNITRTCLEEGWNTPKAQLSFVVRPADATTGPLRYELRVDNADKIPFITWGETNRSRGPVNIGPNGKRVETIFASGEDDLHITVSSLDPSTEVHMVGLSAFATCFWNGRSS